MDTEEAKKLLAHLNLWPRRMDKEEALDKVEMLVIWLAERELERIETDEANEEMFEAAHAASLEQM